MTKILVFSLVSAEGLSRSGLELVAAAGQLREKLGDGIVQVALLGPDAESYGEMLIYHGADEVFVASSPELKGYKTDFILAVLEMATRRISPEVILFPADAVGGEIAPRLAYRLETGIVTDCVGFEVNTESGHIHWLRPVYGGKAMTFMVARGPVQIATFRQRAFEPLPEDSSRRGKVQALEVELEPALDRVSLVEEIREKVEGISLDEAEIVIGGGRGIGGPEGFPGLETLAQILEGAVGSSRPPADSGWVPHGKLIGQTGKILSPNLYIAIGISGAPQHMAGISSAKTIIAINKDEDAPIFKVAHLGVVGNWRQVIPALIQACRELVGD
ncbi:MAG: electron transfer flavoprotein subunit alpha/FixB family protein [Anaerolineales bacterium]|nr:MAG: electron transfer flavoprotein subunit alpha/FixB family protein [Anaerolineales bacterium]